MRTQRLHVQRLRSIGLVKAGDDPESGFVFRKRKGPENRGELTMSDRISAIKAFFKSLGANKDEIDEALKDEPAPAPPAEPPKPDETVTALKATVEKQQGAVTDLEKRLKAAECNVEAVDKKAGTMTLKELAKKKVHKDIPLDSKYTVE